MPDDLPDHLHDRLAQLPDASISIELRKVGPTNEAAYDRVRDFVLQAATSGREPREDWRDAVHDAALDLDKIAYGAFAHPDSVSAAVTAMGSLAGIWLDVDEGDRLYLGEPADE